MAALGDKIRQLDESANRLMQTHPESADTIYAKQKEINEEWTGLTAKVGTKFPFEVSETWRFFYINFSFFFAPNELIFFLHTFQKIWV